MKHYFNELMLAIKEKIVIFIASLIHNHISKCEDIAYKNGYQSGLNQPRRLEIVDLRNEPRVGLESSLYGPKKFKITDHMKIEMRQAVADAVSTSLIPPPTEDQWGMIFSSHPATCVIAGAGSGKSTTLILRIIFMIKHMKINRNSMTVVSFTTAACEELRHDLVEIASHWNLGIDKAQAKKLIRTYHSALCGIARKTLNGVQFFEKYKGNEEPELEEDDDVENPVSNTRLNSHQLELVTNAYKKAYLGSDDFRKHVVEMLKIEAGRSSFLPDEVDIYKSTCRLASQRDEALVGDINKRWKNAGIWPSFLPLTEGPIEAFSFNGYKFFANALNERTGCYIFLGGLTGKDQLYGDDESIVTNEGSISLGMAIGMKRKIIANGCNTTMQYVNSLAMAEKFKLHEIIERCDKEHGFVPYFKIKLEGELSSTDIFEAFYSQASFIESMGLEVTDAIDKMEVSRQPTLEHHFSSALSIFCRFFEETLGEKGIITFNRAFLNLTKNPPSNKLCSSLRHLLIDEFQDISPQIVSWLKTMQRQLIDDALPSVDVSIMAIGDDWQSIYGWRGSSPDFFISFDNHFPSHSSLKRAAVCKMEENFRSNADVVNDAGILVEGIKQKTEKSPRSGIPKEVNGHGAVLNEIGELTSEKITEIKDQILLQLGYANSLSKPHKNRVIVMARSNDVLGKISDEVNRFVKKDSGIVFYTYHKAKGLQGEVAVMVEDTNYDQTHVFRNSVYCASGLFPDGYTYDEAAVDESKRLAYVGITRGKQRVFWYVKEAVGAAKEFKDGKLLN